VFSQWNIYEDLKIMCRLLLIRTRIH
jgi:hypothetical protein